MSKAKADRPSNSPRVYSYIRFSSSEQAFGDSERRQFDAARAFAARRNLPLDETTRLIDRASSGFHGVNRTEGMLGKFLVSVDAGEIPPGSILVVEAIDRLGREDVLTALETVTRIIRKDITICTLQPEAEYNLKSLETGGIFQLVGQIQQAHEFSKLKSRRIREARESGRRRARDEGKTFTRQIPYWLKIDEKGKRVIIPEAAACIRLIFELALQRLSRMAIVRHLNANAPWSPPPASKKDTKASKPRGGNGWQNGYIGKILNNRAVLGEFQPCLRPHGRGGRPVPDGPPILDYFPAVVDTEVFHAFQRMRQAAPLKNGKTRNGGPRGKTFSNLVTHLAKCAYCGGAMTIKNPGVGGGHKRLICANADRRYRRGGVLVCRGFEVRYGECEAIVLENCPKLDPARILPNPSELVERCNRLRLQLTGADGELEVIEAKLANLTERVAEAPTKAIAARVFDQMKLLEMRQKVLQQQSKEASHLLREAESGTEALTMWQSDLEALRKALTDEDYELRMKVHGHLKEFISKVEVFAEGHQKPYSVVHECGNRVQEGDDFLTVQIDLASEFAPKLLKNKEYMSFLEEIAARRRTEEGRFYRVHFKTGQSFDLVPPGSLADGRKLKPDRKNWTHVSVDLVELWRRFRPEIPSLLPQPR